MKETHSIPAQTTTNRRLAFLLTIHLRRISVGVKLRPRHLYTRGLLATKLYTLRQKMAIETAQAQG